MGISPLVATKALDSAVAIIDELFTTKEEKATARMALYELEQRGVFAQIAVNTEEAKSANMFVAGWRPAIGWVCGTAFAMNFVILPLIRCVAIYVGEANGINVDLGALPVLDMSEMMPVLFGMLGIGGLRTYEKINLKA